MRVSLGVSHFSFSTTSSLIEIYSAPNENIFAFILFYAVQHDTFLLGWRIDLISLVKD
jgi:hypothetical protein